MQRRHQPRPEPPTPVGATDASRRTFLTGTAAAVAGLAGASAAGAASRPDTPADPMATLVAFSALAGTGLTPEQIERSRSYLVGAYRELGARLRPLELPDALAPPAHFTTPRRR